MKKTKLVTAIYAYHNGSPFWGQNGRQNWYKYSLVSICNTKLDVICYTDERGNGLNDLLEIKEKFNLTNLTIKIHNLEDNQWHNRVYDIRVNKNPDVYNDSTNIDAYVHRSPDMYWSKFLFLNKEMEPDINLYWIDCGLSHPGLFPKEASSYSNEEGYDKQYPGQSFSEVEYKYYNYDKAFNTETFNRINGYQDSKIINLGRNNITDTNINLFCEKIKDTTQLGCTFYPVGGFFGGNSNLIKEYIDDFLNVTERVLDSGDFICADQEIMWYINSNKPHLFKNYAFDTFCHEDWINAYKPEEVSFSHFFRKPLN